MTTKELASYRELELFDFSNIDNRGPFKALIYDTVNGLGVCWCKNCRTAKQLLENSGYHFKKSIGCWYPQD